MSWFLLPVFDLSFTFKVWANTALRFTLISLLNTTQPSPLLFLVNV